MRSRYVFLGLAACWSKPAPQPVAPQAPKTAAQPAAIAAASAYVLPERVADALAAEPLAGNVLVAGELHTTLAAARADAGPARGAAMAMQVVKDHGDVVELTTARVADCVESFEKPYELTVFVRRDRLVPRTKVEVVKTFADGTAVAIDRGAPVEVTSDGLAWQSSALAETKVRPREDQLGYAVPANLPPAALPATTGEQMICDGGTPMTRDEWQRERDRKREAERRDRMEKERAAAERAHAKCLEDVAKRKARRPKKPKNQREAIAALIGDSCPSPEAYVSMSSLGHAELGSLGYGHGQYLPYCGIGAPYDDFSGRPKPEAAPPRVNGVESSWPTYHDERDNSHVIRHGSYYLGDVGFTCGRVRYRVETAGVRRIGGAGSIGGGRRVLHWVPQPGPVTWEDGSSAGKYTGSKRYQHVEDRGARICVRVPRIAGLVCHDKKTAKTEMAWPSFGD